MKQFLKKTFFLALIPFAYVVFLVSYNLVLDPYGVIKGDMKNQAIEPNKRYLKQKFIINNPSQFNAFLFGNSRVGKINVARINDTNSWYNMSYSEGLPEEHFKDIQLFLEENISIKKIIIGIDEISCFIPPEAHTNDALRKPYKNEFKPLVDYLFLLPSKKIYQEIQKAKNANPPAIGRSQSIYTNGSDPRVRQDIIIENNKEIHENDTIFNYPYWHPKMSIKNIDPAIEALHNIIQLCNENNIELVLFVNPIFEVSYKKAMEDGLLIFLKKVLKIKDIYDFSGVYDITKNKMNYYEASHYRPHVGDLIIDEMNSPQSSFFIPKEKYPQWLEAKLENALEYDIRVYANEHQ